jgi:hypothetical protein
MTELKEMVDTINAMMPGVATYKDFKINHHIESLLPVLDDRSLKVLEESILKDGLREPVVMAYLGKDRLPTLIDGHNRVKIINKHDIDIKFEELDHITTLEQAEEWVLTNQLGRRNLGKGDFGKAVGRLYNLRKKDKGKNLKKGTNPPKGQNDTSGTNPPKGQTTSEILSKETGASEATIKRAAKYMRLVDSDPEIKAKVDNNEITPKEGHDMVVEKRETKIKERLIAGDKVLDIARSIKCSNRLVTKVRKQLKEEGLLKPKSKGTATEAPVKPKIEGTPIEVLIKDKNVKAYDKLVKKRMESNTKSIDIVIDLVNKYL